MPYPDMPTWPVADTTDVEFLRAAVGDHVSWKRRAGRAAGGTSGRAGALDWAMFPISSRR
jgi:hypothetical protein